MSVPVVCAHPQWTVVEAARLMAARNVKRLPVVDETDTVLGIVSRADLLRVFLGQDRAIGDEITHDVLMATPTWSRTPEPSSRPTAGRWPRAGLVVAGGTRVRHLLRRDRQRDSYAP